MPSDPSDHELLASWAKGDSAAGHALARRYMPLLYRFFRTKLDAGVADAVQQTLLALVTKRDSIRDGQKFRAYVLGVARNELLMMYRARTAPQRVGFEGDRSHLALGPTPSAILCEKREQRLLLAALRDLPIDAQLLLELYYWEELPTQEIAQVLGIAAGTVKSRLFRARERLRERISEHDEDEALVRSTLADLEAWAASLRGRLR